MPRQLIKNNFKKISEVIDKSHFIIKNIIQSIQQTQIKDAPALDATDQQQLVLYEMAICYAHWRASQALLAYAEKYQQAKAKTEGATLAALSATYFTSEMLTQLKSCLESPHFAVYYKETDRQLLEGLPLIGLSAEELVQLGHSYCQLDGAIGEDFLDESLQVIRQTFRQFSDDVVAPQAARIHQQDLTVPDDIIEGLQQLGCFGLSIPERYGGLILEDAEDCLGLLVVTEELSRASLGAAGSLITRPEIVARALLAGGTEAQKQLWLPKLAKGQPLCAVAITEPDAGSDVAAIKLKATQVDGGWRLKGTKTWCTLAGKAGLLLVLARTDTKAQTGHKGLTLFLLEKPATDGHSFEVEQGGGLITGRAIPTLGYRGMHSFEIFFDNYFVPDSHVLGEEAGLGKGFYFTMEGFSGGRIQTAARACGLTRAAYESALTYAGQRQLFGQLLKDQPLTACKLAKMAVYLLACRQFTYEVGQLLNLGQGQMEASLVKMFACRTAEWITREALQIHGGLGYAEEAAVSRYWADARVLSIFEGAEEVLALKVVSRYLLKLADESVS